MRFVLLLITALLLSIALIAFPDIADQTLRVEAFGWVFETRQGAFVVALLALLFVIWLLRAVIGALLAGPGQVWRSLRMGSRKRRERHLREALAQWIDMRGDMGLHKLKRARRVIPDWLLDMLKVLMTPAKDLPLPVQEQDPLVTALTARIVTNPATHPRPDLATRKAYLEAWLAVHPGAPLAMLRMAELLEEEQNWKELLALLEDIWQRGHRSSQMIKPRLARAYLKMAELEPDAAMQYLRKAQRLMPDDREVVRTYGRALVAAGDSKAAIRLWRDHLEHENDLDIAGLLLAELRKKNPLSAYRKLERAKDSALNEAQLWLKAELAHAAGLDGLAFEQMRMLAERAENDEVRSVAWRSMGDWYLENGEHGQAALCYRNALGHPPAITAENELDNEEKSD